MNKPTKLMGIAAGMLAVGASPAFAHLNPAEHGSFMAGLSHPLFGLDHILVMVAVGLWAAMNGGRAIWQVPAAFVAAMAGGFALAIAGGNLPFVEPAILASVVALGVLVAAAVRLPVRAGMAIVALFAVFHGYAHGGEIGGATQIQYGLGFIAATVALHCAGIAAGLAIASGRVIPKALGDSLARGLGGVTALLGLGLVIGWL